MLCRYRNRTFKFYFRSLPFSEATFATISSSQENLSFQRSEESAFSSTLSVPLRTVRVRYRLFTHVSSFLAITSSTAETPGGGGKLHARYTVLGRMRDGISGFWLARAGSAGHGSGTRFRSRDCSSS